MSLIGLVPETGGRDVIRSALGAGGLERARSPTCSRRPTSRRRRAGARRSASGSRCWPSCRGPRSASAPGAVKVIAVADSDADRGALEARLAQGGAGGRGADARHLRAAAGDRAVRLRLQPRRRRRARSPPAAPRAPRRRRDHRRRRGTAGLAGPADCAVGLGAPSPGLGARRWRAGSTRCATLGGGRFALRDIAAELTAPEGIAAGAADRGRRARSTPRCPTSSSSTTVAPPRMETAAERRAGLCARASTPSLREDGTVRLAGAGAGRHLAGRRSRASPRRSSATTG